MDIKLAKVIHNQIMGVTSGHMASIPNNPILFSMFNILIDENYDPSDAEKEKGFARVCREIADALDPQEPTK